MHEKLLCLLFIVCLTIFHFGFRISIVFVINDKMRSQKRYSKNDSLIRKFFLVDTKGVIPKILIALVYLCDIAFYCCFLLAFWFIIYPIDLINNIMRIIGAIWGGMFVITVILFIVKNK